MSEQPGEHPEDSPDQDAEPGSRPTGAAAADGPGEDEDQDSGPASEPDL